MIGETSRTIRSERARELQGARAGFATRVAATGIDWVVVNVIYLAILFSIGVARYFFDDTFEMPEPGPIITGYAILVIAVVYLASGWASTGRTLGKSVMGLRVVRADGHVLGFGRALGRAVFCVLLWWLTLAWVLVSRRNAGLDDLAFRTVVVYDWRR